jgi:hypothetical protein
MNAAGRGHGDHLIELNAPPSDSTELNQPDQRVELIISSTIIKRSRGIYENSSTFLTFPDQRTGHGW